MSAPSHHALRFVGTAARLAMKHGLRRGVVLAAEATNPVLLAFEAAASVLDAVQSFSALSEARAVHDGLERQTKHLRKELETLQARLEAERESIGHHVEQARERDDYNADIRRMLNAVARDCMTLVTTALHAVDDARDEDLPDLAAIDAASRDLARAQRRLLDALSTFQSTPTP